MPDTVIVRINTLGKGQPKLLVFHDRSNREIGDVDENTGPIKEDRVDFDIPGVIGDSVEIPGVDMGSDDVTHEFENDLVLTPPQDESLDFLQSPTIKPTANTSDPVVSAPLPVPTALAPVAAPPPGGQRRSTRARQPVQRYVTSTLGKKYSYAARQLAANDMNEDEDKGIPVPHSYMFLMMKNDN
jgi:hypothetical protein